MTDPLLSEIKTRTGVKWVGSSPRLKSRYRGPDLPRQHREWLDALGAISLFDGYFTFVGLDSTALSHYDLESWNGFDTWKFAWPGDLEEYLCFGFTAWGDQYAYRIEELKSSGEASVYFMNALDMTHRKIADSFSQFAEVTLRRNSQTPSDSKIREARQFHGPLAPNLMLSYVPSVLITGDEEVARSVKMTQRDVMILNGDLWSQLREPPASEVGIELVPWSDGKGRSRMRVVWTN